MATDAKAFWELPVDVDPAWAARRRLAAALRELAERCVSTEAPTEALDAAASTCERVLTELPPGPGAHAAFTSGAYFAEPTRWTDRVAMMGWSNPFAPPIAGKWTGDRAEAVFTLGETYGGAPGMAHGGIIAACFDQMCGHAVIGSGRSGLTGRLTVTYRRPVPLHVALRWSAWVAESSGERLRVAATCERDGHVLAEADAVFVCLEPKVARGVIAKSRGEP